MAVQSQQFSQHSPNQHVDELHDWQQYATRGKEQLQEMVADNTGRSMLIALGAGLGVGLLIGTVLGSSERPSRFWNRSAAEGLGSQLLNRLEKLVPDAINERFGS